MALNLSTLTSPATSGDVLAEALTTADFLEPVPVLRNLARGSQKGGDAKQDVALNQPKALPLAANGKGYCYLPVTTGNAPAVTFPTIGADDDFVLEMDVYLVDASNFHLVSGSSTQKRIIVYNNGTQFQFNINSANTGTLTSPLNAGASTITCERTNGTFFLKQDGVTKGTIANAQGNGDFSHLSFNGQYSTGVPPLNGYIQTCTLSIEGTEQLNIDFTATNVRHGDTKFACATGQVVTINQSGNDPATIIKKSVLRFSSATSGLRGLFANQIDSGYMFASFSLLGTGVAPSINSARVFSINTTGGLDYTGGGGVFSARLAPDNLRSIVSNTLLPHDDLYDSENGDILHEVRLLSGSGLSRVNNADEQTYASTHSLQGDEFNINQNEGRANSENAAMDLEYLALFPATITDAQAADVVKYINNRNTVFLRHDTDGYYFFDPLSLTADAPVASWNGQIVGSDNDANLTITQSTSNSQPDRLAPDKDGMVVRFNDSNDHLIVPNSFVEPSAGWQVVGTSLGTFAYRVNANAVTELNLLGNLGSASYRKAGDLYGIILLPESATGKDIEDARKLLIDRGAADGTTSGSIFTYWYNRDDIVEFKHINTSSVTYSSYAWYSCQALEKFPALDLSNSTTLNSAWLGCTVLSDFGAIQADYCTNFSSAWKSCSSLTSFPAGAKLGTAATGVDFTEAWRESGITSFNTDLPTGKTFQKTWRESALTSFGSIDLSSGTSFNSSWQLATSLSSFGAIDARNGTTFQEAWRNCSSLQSFPAGAKLGTEANNVDFSSAWRESGLTSFSTPLPTATLLGSAWRDAPLTSFDSMLPLATRVNASWRDTLLSSFSIPLPKPENLNRAWLDCASLTEFSADVFADWNPALLTTGVFNKTWDNCPLTAQSVENILTSIDASGHFATTNKVSGGTALGDAGIDIDYDGTTLSAATNAAIDSLSGKGWEVFINGVLVIPNILDLQPAAAYSLRSFDADADPNVVNVRRSSDGASSDFKASEVSDGTLRDWTLGDTLALDGQRMYFDGVNDKVDVSGVDIGSYSEITIKTRFLWNNGIDANEGIFSNNSTGSNRFGLYVSDKLTFYIGDGSSTFHPSLVTLNKNQYYTVVATAKVENGQMTANIFVEGLIDGTENSISTSATDFSVVAQNWVIGYLNINRYFEGIIDYVDVYEGYSTDGSVTGMTKLHGWSNTNITDASWTDSVGSADGTVSGTPALFSGQGFDGHVTTWYDQGGTNHATQPLVSNMPKLVDAGTLVTEGGLAALDFGADADELSLVASSYDAASIFAVTKPNTSSGNPLLGVLGNKYIDVEADTLAYRVTSFDDMPFTNDFTQQLAVVIREDGTGAQPVHGYRNGVVSTEDPCDTNQELLTGAMSIGRRATSDYYDGTIQEIVIYDSDQSANRTGIENNINSHFTIYS